jgi:hypothetical protein
MLVSLAVSDESGRTAAFQNLAEGVACDPSRQSRGRGRVRLSSAALTCIRRHAPYPQAESTYGEMEPPYVGCYNHGVTV